MEDNNTWAQSITDMAMEGVSENVDWPPRRSAPVVEEESRSESARSEE